MQTEADIRRIVQVLGLPVRQGFSQLWFSDELSKGLPVASLERVQALVAPGLSSFTKLIVAEGTLKRRRRQQRPLSPQESQRLERVARVWTMALDVYGREEDARRFLNRPHPLLQQRIPLELAVANDVGADAVEGILGRLKYGSAA